MVIFAELSWTPALLLQAEDRVNRIGQTQACHMIYLLGQNTADDLMWPLVARKFRVLSSTLDGSRGPTDWELDAEK